VEKSLEIHVLFTYIIEIKFEKHRLSTLGRGLHEMAHIPKNKFRMKTRMLLFDMEICSL
jgi:hypothetical protein